MTGVIALLFREVLVGVAAAPSIDKPLANSGVRFEAPSGEVAVAGTLEGYRCAVTLSASDLVFTPCSIRGPVTVLLALFLGVVSVVVPHAASVIEALAMSGFDVEIPAWQSSCRSYARTDVKL